MESDVGIPSHILTGAKRAEAPPLLRQSRIADVITASSLFGLLRGLGYPRRRDKLRSSGSQKQQLNSEKRGVTAGYEPFDRQSLDQLLTGVQKDKGVEKCTLGGTKLDPRGTKTDPG